MTIRGATLFLEYNLRKVRNIMMTKDEKEKCQYIIHSAAAAGAGVGALPIPGPDIIPLIGIQSAMILGLATIFKISMTETAAKDIAKTAITGQMGKMLAGQLSKLIPGAGSVINATIAAGLTEKLGWDIAEDVSTRKK